MLCRKKRFHFVLQVKLQDNFWLLVFHAGVKERACYTRLFLYVLLIRTGSDFTLISVFNVVSGGALGWMSGVVNLVLSWRWTFHILGIAGLLMTPVTMMAVYEPKAVRTKRRERMKGKSTYTILVC